MISAMSGKYEQGREIGLAICAAIPVLCDDMRRGIADAIHCDSRNTLIAELMRENVSLKSALESECLQIVEPARTASISSIQGESAASVAHLGRGLSPV